MEDHIVQEQTRSRVKVAVMPRDLYADLWTFMFGLIAGIAVGLMVLVPMGLFS